MNQFPQIIHSATGEHWFLSEAVTNGLLGLASVHLRIFLCSHLPQGKHWDSWEPEVCLCEWPCECYEESFTHVCVCSLFLLVGLLYGKSIRIFWKDQWTLRHKTFLKRIVNSFPFLLKPASPVSPSVPCVIPFGLLDLSILLSLSKVA